MGGPLDLLANEDNVCLDELVTLQQILDAEQMLAVVVNLEQFAQVLQIVVELLHLLEDLVERVRGLETLPTRLDQLKQIIPKHVDVAFARVYALNVVVVLLVEDLGNVDDVADALFKRANVGLNGFLLLEGGLDRLEIKAKLVRDDQLLRVVEPLFAHCRFLVEFGRQLFEVLLADQFLPQCQFSLMLGLF